MYIHVANGKATFPASLRSLQCHMILQKSFWWFAAQETFIIINLNSNA